MTTALAYSEILFVYKMKVTAMWKKVCRPVAQKCVNGCPIAFPLRGDGLLTFIHLVRLDQQAHNPILRSSWVQKSALQGPHSSRRYLPTN